MAAWLVKDGHWPRLAYPRVPGHEIAGTVDSAGPGVTEWKPGDRVGIGWHGRHCGYEQYMIARANGLARIPDALGFAEAAPLLCAGVTPDNSLRHSRALPGDVVAVHGIGGLGRNGMLLAIAGTAGPMSFSPAQLIGLRVRPKTRRIL